MNLDKNKRRNNYLYIFNEFFKNLITEFGKVKCPIMHIIIYCNYYLIMLNVLKNICILYCNP
jgi:hypothetical protein